jgi:predicted 3-demethylubiquinone-9 3-methyltransferase (glyoxalase superfamily)
MVKEVRPFLMFEGKAEEAVNFYVSLLPESSIVEMSYYGSEGPGAEGSVSRASFKLKDQMILCFDSPPVHKFTFTPSFSLFVDCESEEEIERLTSSLLKDGEALMPLSEYGFSRKFAWVNDRYGVSWQLNLP